MTDITIMRPCVKFKNWLSWMEEERFFSFDPATEKYRYHRRKDDPLEVEEKARNIYKGEYEYNNQVHIIIFNYFRIKMVWIRGIKGRKILPFV